MDWKIFFATFGTIFIAELGDKTQIANLCLSSRSRSPLTVLIASIAAFSLVSLITVTFSAFLCRVIRPEYIRYGAASLFIIVGILMFWGKI